MQRNKPLIIILAFLLFTSVFAVIPTFSAQPPVGTTTYYIGATGQPRNVDPTLAYDTASGELIFNVAEPLIFFGDHKFLPPETSKINDTDYDSLDPATFVPALAKYMPLVEPNMDRPGSNWTFQIDTTVKFQNWTDSIGVVRSGQTVTPEDVIYHFQRMFTFDSFESPQWMFTVPMFGGSGWFEDDPLFDADNSTVGIQPIMVNHTGERLVKELIQTHIVKASPTNVTFVFDYNWNITVLYQTFAQSWGCIEPMNFCIEHGCWNGTFYDGWSTDDANIGVSNYPAPSATPLDRHTPRSKYASASAEPAICGSGPYQFTSWDRTAQEWRIDKFNNYHKGWAGNHVTTVISTGIDSWPTRKMMFLQGEFDTCYVPRGNMYDLLDTSAPDPSHTPIPGIILYYGEVGWQSDFALFNFNMSTTGKYVPKVNGLRKPDMFNDVHVRRAFASSVSFTKYINDVWYGEASHPASWWITGLSPDYENKSVQPWDYDPTVMSSELALAGVSCFDITVSYKKGDREKQLYFEQMRDNFKALNPQFRVTVLGEEWPALLTDAQSDQLPLWSVDWRADITDIYSFARTFMYSTGAFSYFQHVDLDPQSTVIDDEIDLALNTTDTSVANATYQTLQQQYKDLAWGVPIVQPIGRSWHREWVRNVEVNQLYPGIYAYFRYKTAAGVLKNIDLNVITITPVVSYATVYVYKGQMRIGYKGAGIGSAAPAVQVYDIRLDRTDAVPSLVLAVIGLKRTNLTRSPAESFAYPNSTYVLLAPAPTSVTVRLTYYEDGSLSTLPSSVSGVTWQMAARTDVITFDCQDTNGTNSLQNIGTVVAYSANVGDINGDGIVDILDAITLAGIYGKMQCQTGWNPDANLNGTPDPLSGKQVIDILDAITLANNFAKHNQP